MKRKQIERQTKKRVSSNKVVWIVLYHLRMIRVLMILITPTRRVQTKILKMGQAHWKGWRVNHLWLWEVMMRTKWINLHWQLQRFSLISRNLMNLWNANSVFENLLQVLPDSKLLATAERHIPMCKNTFARPKPPPKVR
jgi:hypothetical protein